MGFSNSFVGGMGTLIRQFLKSPNYVPGVSGWSINKDGSVEFSDGVFRGIITNGGMFIYNGAPAAGNLIFAVSPTAGVDAFGNTWHQGVNTADTLIVPGPSSISLGGINNANSTGTISSSNNNQVILSGPIDGSAHQAELTITNNVINRTSTDPVSGGVNDNILPGSFGWSVNDSSGAGKVIEIDGNPLVFKVGQNGHAFQFGAGAVGKYYDEAVTVDPAQNFPSGVSTQLTNLTQLDIESNYGSGWNLATGVWTCPVTGKYDVTFSTQINAFVAGARYVPIIRRNGAMVMQDEMAPAAGFAAAVLSGELPKLTAGDTLTFLIDQVSGAGKTLANSSYITIARRL